MFSGRHETRQSVPTVCAAQLCSIKSTTRNKSWSRAWQKTNTMTVYPMESVPEVNISTTNIAHCLHRFSGRPGRPSQGGPGWHQEIPHLLWRGGGRRDGDQEERQQLCHLRPEDELHGARGKRNGLLVQKYKSDFLSSHCSDPSRHRKRSRRSPNPVLRSGRRKSLKSLDSGHKLRLDLATGCLIVKRKKSYFSNIWQLGKN